MLGWGAVGRRGSGAALILGLTLTGCSSTGSVAGTAKTSAVGTSGRPPCCGAPTTGKSVSSGLQGSPTASSAQPDTTPTKDEAAAALTAYQRANNAANAALDTAAIAEVESGSLLAVDKASMVYDQGAGGTRAKRDEASIALNDPVFYLVRSTDYPRGFFAVVQAVASGSPSTSVLLHFNQDHAGAPWLVDRDVYLSPGRQWPAFAVASDGTLDFSATHQHELVLNTMDLVVADRTVIVDDNAGKPASPFASDDVTTAEEKWIQNQKQDVSPAKEAVTVSTDPDPLPTYVPLKDGGELVLYTQRVSLGISQPGRTFSFGDQGYVKLAGKADFDQGFTEDSLYMAAAVDPPDKTAKILKIASNGGLVSVHS